MPIHSSVLIHEVAFWHFLKGGGGTSRHLRRIFWIIDIDVHGCQNWRALVASVHNNRCNWCQLSELSLASCSDGSGVRAEAGLGCQEIQLDKESDAEDTWRIEPEWRLESGEWRARSEGGLLSSLAGWRMAAAGGPSSSHSWQLHTRGCSSCASWSMTPLEDWGSCQLNTSWCCVGGWTRSWARGDTWRWWRRGGPPSHTQASPHGLAWWPQRSFTGSYTPR